MGGTDPSGAIVQVADSIMVQRLDIYLDLVSPKSWLASVRNVVAGAPAIRVFESTPDLPAVLGDADIVVCAAGTSAWDVCAMARPGIFVALVDNQKKTIEQVLKSGVALGLDATVDGSGTIGEVGPVLESLLSDSDLQRELVERCYSTFDGLGKFRVVEAMERFHE